MNTIETEHFAPARTGCCPRHTGILLAQLGRAATRQYRAALSPVGLNPRQTAALLVLREEGPLSQQALGAALDTDASNLVGLLNDLEANGLISRRRATEDRRRHVVEISARGSRQIEEVEQAANGIDERFFAELNGDERRLLRDLLVRVAQSADVRVPAAEPDDEDC